MNPLLRIKLAMMLSGAIFWAPMIVVYFRNFGIDDTQVYALIAFYSASVALLEFPTGVIGDYYSQAFSVKTGYLILFLSFIFLSLPLTLFQLYLAQFASALGMALTSGCDAAVMAQHSEDIAKDTKQVEFWQKIVLLVSFSIGSLMYKVNPASPVMLTGVFLLVCYLLVATLKDKETATKFTGNIFAKAKEGLRLVKNSKTLRLVVSVAAMIVGFELSIKYLYNDLFLGLGLDLQFHGMIMSLFMLLQIIGLTMYKKKMSKRNYFALLIQPLVLLLAAFSRNLFLTVGLLMLMAGTRGLNDIFLRIVTIEETPQGNRASVLSLKSFLQRLVSVGYIFMIGIVSANLSIYWVMTFASIILFLTVAVFFISYRKIES